MATQYDPTVSLKRKASRWQTLPPHGEEDSKDLDIVDGKYSLLLFLRDLNTKPDAWNDFVNGLRNAPGVADKDSTMAAVLAAALETRQIQYDYIDPAARDAKRQRINLYGNHAAGAQVAEYDALVAMARTVWNDPDDLRNFVGKAYRENLRNLAEGIRERYSFDSIFDFARSWSEVRYRFMNHALRDDPTLHTRYNSGRVNTKGNAANTIVHESNVLLDARMVEFLHLRGTGYAPQDRGIYEELYLLTPEEGRQLLRYSGANSGLRIGLPNVFRYCVEYIDAYMNWRVRVLEAARKKTLNSQAYRNATNFNAKQTIRNNANGIIYTQLTPADNEYGRIVGALRTLLDEAKTLNAFNRASYDEIEAASIAATTAVRNCAIVTTTPELQQNNRFQTELRNFPGNISLSRPTGSSLIATPRRRPIV
ncbi:hypothetical protein F4803DRAFT_564518 [Xylaria telfairii]|nr:hypothetical protein F4803DRAFT_564518 [Xylaria telfairii]